MSTDCKLNGPWYCLLPADDAATSNIFGLSEYLSIVALFLVVLVVSDFRYRFRLSVARYDLKRITFAVTFAIGILLLFVDVLFVNAWKIPKILNQENNLRALLGFLFLITVFYLIYVSFIKPPRFNKSNSWQYYTALHYYVGRADEEELFIVGDEFGSSAAEIIESASQITITHNGNKVRNRTPATTSAWNCLLLVGSKQFCKVLVKRNPWVVAHVFELLAEKDVRDLPLGSFARNVGIELVVNTGSPLHTENEDFASDLLGYQKPVSTAVFGNYKLVEGLAANFGSPLDVVEVWTLKPECLRAFGKATLIFSKSYLTDRHHHEHSFAFFRSMSVFEHAASGLYRINGSSDDYWSSDEYQKLKVTVHFIHGLIQLIDKCDVEHIGPLKPQDTGQRNVHDRVAQLIFEQIFHASSVSEPTDLCWHVQRNTVWSDVFGYEDSKTSKIIKFKLRRLLYDEIRHMDEYANFKGCRILGFCLNVLGLNEERGNHEKEEHVAFRVPN